MPTPSSRRQPNFSWETDMTIEVKMPALSPTMEKGTLAKWLVSAGDMRSEEHTSELQSLMRISYDVLCLKKKNTEKYTRRHKIHLATRDDTYAQQRITHR